MKRTQDMTDDQAVQIGKLALSEFINDNTVLPFLMGKKVNLKEFNFRIEREIWSSDESLPEGEKELQVIRLYLHGFGDTFIAIWDDFNIECTVDGDDYHTSGQVEMFKALVAWGFVTV